MQSSARKFFLIGFVVLLLIGIPVSVYFLQQQQTVQQQAAPATKFSFAPDSTESNPITKNVGDSVPLDVMVDPGTTNIVSSVTIEINYDPEKLEAASDAFQTDKTVFPNVFSGPDYTPGKIVVTLAIDSPNKALQTKTKAATVTFKAKAKTSTPTRITYNTTNSIATSRGPNDQALENVLLLSSILPAFVTINDGAAPTAGPPAPTAEPSAAPTAAPTTPPASGPVNAAPSCVALTADQNSGTAPFTVNFTANGTDSDGTVSKVTFNFGDGQVSDVTSGGGIGSASANAQIAHTYTSDGSFQASALLTDNGNSVSSGNCTQAISVSAGAVATATPTIAPSGSIEVLFGIGAASILFIIGGALIFLVL